MLQIPNFTDENMPSDGESPTQDGEADGEWPLRTAIPQTGRRGRRFSKLSKIIAGSALAIQAAGYQPLNRP